MTRYWDFNEIEQYSESNLFNFEPFGLNYYKQMRVMQLNETVLRTRIQGQVVIGTTSPAMFGLSYDLEEIAASRLAFGLWTNPHQLNGGAPQPIPATPYDSNWLQHGVMSVAAINSPYVDGTGATRCSVLFKLDTGLSESFAQRGPAQVMSDIILVWGFYNPIKSYWNLNVGGQTGIFSAAIGVHMLVET